MNIGVAAHVTAAAPGGPRYDSAITAEERASIANAIWLCQACAKLVDSDVHRYSIALLRSWKVQAEAAALSELENRFVDDSPTVLGRRHVPIPPIGGRDYREAREMLIAAGWQPLSQSNSYGNDVNANTGNGPLLWAMGFRELCGASGTGLAHCWFQFIDVYANRLVVMTAGEMQSESDMVVVCRWYFEDDH